MMKHFILMILLVEVICSCVGENSTETNSRQARERSVFSVRRVRKEPIPRLTARISSIGPSENDLHGFHLRPFGGAFIERRPKLPPGPGFYTKDGYYMGNKVLKSYTESDPVKTLIKSLLMPQQYVIHSNSHYHVPHQAENMPNKRYFSYKPVQHQQVAGQKPFRPSVQISTSDVVVGSNKVKPSLPVEIRTESPVKQKSSFFVPQGEDTASFQVGAKTQQAEYVAKENSNIQYFGLPQQHVSYEAPQYNGELLYNSQHNHSPNTGGYFQPSQSYSLSQANAFLNFMRSPEYFLPKVDPDYRLQSQTKPIYEVKLNSPPSKLSEVPTETYHYIQSPQIEIYPKTKTEAEKVIEFLPQKVEFTQDDAVTAGYDYPKGTKESAPEIDIRGRFGSDGQVGPTKKISPSKITLSKYSNFGTKKHLSKYNVPRPSDPAKLKGYEVYEKVPQRRTAEDITSYASPKTETLTDSKACERNCTETFIEHEDDQPVCGTDNQTYSSEDLLDCINSCRAEEDVIDVEYDGRCSDKKDDDDQDKNESLKPDTTSPKTESSVNGQIPTSRT